MSVLKNPRHERFCQAIASGRSHRLAYIEAGYTSTLEAADASAARLLREARVSARISELHAQTAKQVSASAARVLEEMSKLAFANMQDFVGADGVPLPVTQLGRDQAAAITELTVDTYVEGRGEDAKTVRRRRIKLADKRAVLVDLGRHLGLFKDKVEHSGPGGGPIETKDISDIDCARRIAFMLERAARKLAEPPEGTS